MLRIIDFTIEYTHGDMAIATKKPRFSWKLESDKKGVMQTAYELKIVGNDYVCDTGIVKSEKSIFVDVCNKPLSAATEYTAELTVLDNQGESAKAKLSFETALFDTGFLSAKFIAPDFSFNPDCAVVYKKINLSKKPVKARAYISALGMYTLKINGIKAGDLYFAPFWTDYKYALEYQTYDITEHLKKGENLIEIEIAKGWYRARLADYGNNLFGETNAAIAEIRIDENTYVTDADWSARESEITASELYDGETFDYTKDLSKIYSVKVIDYDKARLIAQINEPCRITERISAVKKILTTNGEQVFDFGQNLVGNVQLNLKTNGRTAVTIKYAEMLDDDGNFYTENLRTAKSTDSFVLNAGEWCVNARYTFHGFRYIKVEGVELNTEQVTALVIGSDLKANGNIVTSDKALNRLIENLKWTQRGNFVDVPTDCPQRDERLGWTGDIAVFCGTAVLQYNTALFFKKWLADMRNGQTDDGRIPTIVPSPVDVAGTSAIWSDSATIVPWAVYNEYGDKKVLEDHFGCMYAYVKKLLSLRNHKGLIQSGHQFGDWLALDADEAVDVNRGATDVYFIANAYFANSLHITAQAAEILGKTEIAGELAKEHEKLISAIQGEYFTATGRMVCETQTSCTLALKFGITPDKFKAKTVETLKNCIEKRKNKLSTGFAATQHILPVLAENGLFDKAEKLLLNKECPGWLYEVAHGATTVWERWNAILPDGKLNNPAMNSFNHYAFASVGEFLYRKIAGIETVEAGYKKFRIKPNVLKDIAKFTASIDSPYGMIESAYKLEGNKLMLKVVIPVNTSAEIECYSVKQTVGSGKYEFEIDVTGLISCDTYTLDSTVKDIMENEAARAAAIEIAPEIFGSDTVKMIYGLTFSKLCNMASGIKERINDILRYINDKTNV